MTTPVKACFRKISGCPGRFSTHVVGPDGAAHLELTLYANKAAESLARRSVPVYLGEVIRVFSWATQDRILQEDEQSLLGPADQVRRILKEYLFAACECVLREKRDDTTTLILVRQTNKTRINVRVTLSAMKHFYAVLVASKLRDSNPLVSQELRLELDRRVEQIQREYVETYDRRSPANSGGVDDPWRHRLRMSTNYFQLVDGKWQPKLIDDPHLHVLAYKAGEQFEWSQRETIIARMMFESGARIGEITALSLGDWLLHGCLTQIASASKGSNGLRVKTLLISNTTAHLLRRYWNTERCLFERTGNKTLADFKRAVKLGQVDPNSIPIFLSRRGKPYLASTFRDQYWKPALRAAGLQCQPHQARHWHVTNALEEINQTSANSIDRQLKRDKLVKYMRWRSGQAMLDVYDHSMSGVPDHIPLIHDRMLTEEKRYRSTDLALIRNTPRTDATRQRDDLDEILSIGNRPANAYEES